MAIALHNVVLKQTKLLLQHIKYISISCGEASCCMNLKSEFRA
jgi:hypothetical protein